VQSVSYLDLLSQTKVECTCPYKKTITSPISQWIKWTKKIISTNFEVCWGIEEECCLEVQTILF